MPRTLAARNITEGVIWKQLLSFFFPILLGTFFQQMYNTADTIIVGRFVGTRALAAVGSTAALLNLINGFFLGIGSGATVLLSQFFGAGDRTLERIRELMNARSEAYEECADIVIDTDKLSLDEVVAEIVLRLKDAPLDPFSVTQAVRLARMRADVAAPIFTGILSLNATSSALS